MLDVQLDPHKSEKLLEKALEKDSHLLLQKTLAEASENRRKPTLLTIWKPSKDIHVADVLVARIISAVGFMGCDCHVYFSNHVSSDLVRREQEELEAWFAYSFFADLFRRFSVGDHVRVARMFPHRVQVPMEIVAAYKAFWKGAAGLSDEEKKQRHLDPRLWNKPWPQDEKYCLPLISLVADIAKTNTDLIFLFGNKHKWIWKPFILRIIEDAINLKPKVLCVRNIKGLNGRLLRDEDKDGCLLVHSSRAEVLRRLMPLDDTLKSNPCLRQLFEWLSFPSGATTTVPSGDAIQNIKSWNSLDLSPQDRRAAASELISTTFSQIRHNIGIHNRVFGPPPVLELTNRIVADAVTERLCFGTDYFLPKRECSLDDNPGEYREGYLKAVKQTFASECAPLNETERLSGVIESCHEIDRLLMLFKKRHRDHFAHQFNVFGLGLLLLHSTVESGETLATKLANKLNISEPELCGAWALAGLLHDHAYPLAYFLELQPRLYALLPATHEQNLLDTMNSAIKDLVPQVYHHTIYDAGSHAIEKVWHKMLEAWTEISHDNARSIARSSYIVPHGLLGATNCWLKLGKPHYSSLSVPMRLALQAIAEHDQDKGLPVHFEQQPLSALLRLCDELHEWGRPVLMSTADGFGCPIQRVATNLNSQAGGRESIPIRLEAEFLCADRQSLDNTEWQEGFFWPNKVRALRTIGLFPSGQSLSQMVVSLRMPSEVYGG